MEGHTRSSRLPLVPIIPKPKPPQGSVGGLLGGAGCRPSAPIIRYTPVVGGVGEPLDNIRLLSITAGAPDVPSAPTHGGMRGAGFGPSGITQRESNARSEKCVLCVQCEFRCWESPNRSRRTRLEWCAPWPHGAMNPPWGELLGPQEWIPRLRCGGGGGGGVADAFWSHIKAPPCLAQSPTLVTAASTGEVCRTLLHGDCTRPQCRCKFLHLEHSCCRAQAGAAGHAMALLESGACTADPSGRTSPGPGRLPFRGVQQRAARKPPSQQPPLGIPIRPFFR